MVVRTVRDAEATRSGLADWCSRRMAGGRRVEVELLAGPRSQGFANETLPFDAIRDGRRERLVARVAPTTHRVYPLARLPEQYRLLEVLGRDTDVPVPRVHGYEEDPDVLGAPFFVMGRVEGRVPADLPSYHREGWVAGLTPAGRERLWHNGLEVLRRVHRLDPVALGLRSVETPGDAPTWFDRELDHYEHHLDFFRSASSPTALRALAWLRTTPPTSTAPTSAVPIGLLWGDARLGNLVFSGVVVAAVLDWEMAALGPAEADLAWFLHLDEHLSNGIGARRLPGLPDRAETTQRYAEMLGRPLHDFDWHRVFAAFRFALVAARVTELLVLSGMVPADVDFPLRRNAVALLERTLAEVDRSTGPSPHR